MATLATDDFAGTGALSGNWTAVDGGLTRSAGEAVPFSALPILNSVRYTGVAAPNNQWAQCTVGSVVETTSDNGVGPCVRFAVGGNFYILQGNTVETRVYKRVDGVYTQLGSDGPAVAATDLLYLEAQGTTLVAKKNGSSICGSPITDASNDSGSAGVWDSSYNIASTLDNFAFGDFTSANQTVDVGSKANRPGRGPYSIGMFRRERVDAYTSITTQTRLVTPQGGLQFGGASAVLRGVVFTPTGGLQFGGTAPFAKGYVIAPTGGLQFGGATAPPRSRVVIPTGGLNFGGAATVTTHKASRTVTPTGGIVFGGSSPVSFFSVGSGNGDGAPFFVQRFMKRPHRR